jgi:amino acid transporter
MMPMPRIVYAMAKDGLLFRFLATVHPKFKTPFSATLVTGALAAVFAMVTELDALVDMMSIGTLLAYTLVAVSILILRFQFYSIEFGRLIQSICIFSLLPKRYEKDSSKGDVISSECVALPWQREPTEASARKSKMAITIYCMTYFVNEYRTSTTNK